MVLNRKKNQEKLNELLNKKAEVKENNADSASENVPIPQESSIRYIPIPEETREYRYIINLATDNKGILEDIDDCKNILNSFETLGRTISPDRFKKNKRLINICLDKIKNFKDKIAKETYTTYVKVFTLDIIFNINYRLNRLLENTNLKKVTYSQIKSLLKNNQKPLDLNLNNVESIDKVKIDLSEILEKFESLFPEIKLPKKVFEPIALTNDLNHMVGGSAITSGCKALRDKDRWNKNGLGKACYEHTKAKNPNSRITHFINDFSDPEEIKLLPYNEAIQILDKFGEQPALLHLILAVHFYRQPDPQEAKLFIKGTDLIKDLGLDKRSDLTRSQKLEMVSEIVTAVRSLIITAKWSSSVRIGKKTKQVNIEVEPTLMWNISPARITQKDIFGNEELKDLEIIVKAGAWLGHFFNQAGRELGKALYNFATLSRKILNLNPYKEKLALRIALLQSTMDYRQYYMVEQWLRENLPGAKARIADARKDKRARKKLAELWDNTLTSLERIAYTIHFDERTYPKELRPDSDRKPRGYFEKLLQAKIKLTPESLGKPQSEIELEEANQTKLKTITSLTTSKSQPKLSKKKTYSGKILKDAREKEKITPKAIAGYLKCSTAKIYNSEKRANITKKTHDEIMDAIEYIAKNREKFKHLL